MDCAICKTIMPCLSYDEKSEEGITQDCYRLSCKHAFHAMCLVQSLRISGKSCPTCRNCNETNNSSSSIPIIHISIDDDLEADNIDDENEIVLNRYLNYLHSTNPLIRAAKQNLNQSMKSYNMFRDKLRHEKKLHLKKAMLDFRLKRFKDFNVKKQQVQLSLNQYHQSLKNEVGNDVFQLMNLEELLKQPTGAFHSVRHQDPMRTSFWHH